MELHSWEPFPSFPTIQRFLWTDEQMGFGTWKAGERTNLKDTLCTPQKIYRRQLCSSEEKTEVVSGPKHPLISAKKIL